MSTIPDQDAIDLLMETVEAEGSPLLVFPGQPLPAPDELPPQWRELLAGRESPAAFIARAWAGLQEILPRTLELLPARTTTIALLRTASRPPSLVYLFGADKNLYANRGFAPRRLPAGPAVPPGAWPVDVAPFLAVHDGWVDFFSLDGGLLPADDWRVAAEDEAPFLQIFRNGASAAGFELADPGAGILFLDTDEDQVAQVPDFWRWLDDYYVTSLEELEDAE